MAEQVMNNKAPINLGTPTNFSKAILLDTFIWSYIALVCYKIIYQKIIIADRYAQFDWGQPMTALGVGFVLSLIIYFTPFSVGKEMFLASKYDRLHKNPFKMPFSYVIYLTIGLTFIAGIFVSQISLREFFSEAGLFGAKRIFGALLAPNFAIIDQAVFAAVETIYMAFIATVVALPFAFIIGFFAARNLMNNSMIAFGIYNITRFFLNTTRSIEPLVWAIIFSVWVGIGPFAGMLALCLHSVSSLAKLYSEQIENISDGPIEAMKATGAKPIQVIWYGVVPQIVLPYLSFTIYRWDINVRMATIIGLVGGGGIGTMLMQYQGQAMWNEVGLLAIVIAVIVWVMDWSSSKIRAAIK